MHQNVKKSVKFVCNYAKYKKTTDSRYYETDFYISVSLIYVLNQH